MSRTYVIRAVHPSKPTRLGTPIRTALRMEANPDPVKEAGDGDGIHSRASDAGSVKDSDSDAGSTATMNT
eukprot:5779403-Prymnesium_polylepis.1